jgi:hypothetical protein
VVGFVELDTARGASGLSRALRFPRASSIALAMEPTLPEVIEARFLGGGSSLLRSREREAHEAARSGAVTRRVMVGRLPAATFRTAAARAALLLTGGEGLVSCSDSCRLL